MSSDPSYAMLTIFAVVYGLDFIATMLAGIACLFAAASFYLLKRPEPIPPINEPFRLNEQYDT